MPIKNDPTVVWCRINARVKLKKLIENFTTNEISESQLDKLLGHLTVHEMWTKLGIKWKGRNQDSVLAEIEDLKKSGEYYKKIKKAFPRGIYNPNIMCLVAQKYLPNSKLLRGWQVVKVLGSGVFGTVMLAQKGTKLRAVKVMSPSGKDWVTPQEEFNLQKYAYKIGISPKILDLSRHRKHNREMVVLIMETMDMDLVTYLKCIHNLIPKSQHKHYLKSLFRAFRDLLLKMKQHNFTHGDMHPGNVMLRWSLDKKSMDLYLIDFGQSSCRVHNPWVDVSQFLRVLEWDFPDMYQIFKEFLNYTIKEMYPDKNLWPQKGSVLGTEDEFDILHDNYSENIGCDK